MDRTEELVLLFVEGGKTATARAKMRVIVRAVEKVGHTPFFRNCTKKTSHGKDVCILR